MYSFWKKYACSYTTYNTKKPKNFLVLYSSDETVKILDFTVFTGFFKGKGL